MKIMAFDWTGYPDQESSRRVYSEISTIVGYKF